MKNAWKIIITLVILFALFYVLTRPEQAAQAVTAIGGFIGNAATSISRFFSALATG